MDKSELEAQAAHDEKWARYRAGDQAQETLRLAAAAVHLFFEDEQAAIQNERAAAAGQMHVGICRPSARNTLIHLRHLLREWAPPKDQP